MKEHTTKPTNQDPGNESGRISRSGTSAGISVGNESTSGGSDPIQPGGKPDKSEQKTKPDR